MIRHAPLDLEKIKNLIADTRKFTDDLRNLTNQSLEDWAADRHRVALTEHYIERATENILTIGTHILSRLPSKLKDYEEVILFLGRENIVPMDFAEKNRALSGFRNLLVHQYWEVDPKRLYNIVKEHLGDLDKFCDYFEVVLRNSGKWGLRVE